MLLLTRPTTSEAPPTCDAYTASRIIAEIDPMAYFAMLHSKREETPRRRQKAKIEKSESRRSGRSEVKYHTQG